MQIRISGLGWYGLPLARSLASRGHDVSGTVTSDEKVSRLNEEGIKSFKLKYPDLPPEINSDILILNIPPFAEELQWFKQWKVSSETWVIFISSTSVLSKNDELLNSQEEWVKTLPKWTILRLGGLFGDHRHPGKHLSGKKNLPGKLWPVNMLHLDDAIGFTETIINQKIKAKTFNVFSSDHPTREKFYTDYCRKNHLPFPEFDPEDHSVKEPLDNSLAAQIYSFLPLK